MSLLRQIQVGATDQAVPLTTTLRRAKVLAYRLDHQPFKDWVRLELDGYPHADDAPPYRFARGVHVLGHLIGPYGDEVRNRRLSKEQVPTGLEPLLELFTHWWPDGVGVLEDMIDRGTPAFEFPWSATAVSLLEDKLFTNYRLVAAKVVLPREAVVAVLEAVRNRLLDFALEIEALNPAAGEAMPDEVPVPPQAVSQVFNTTINGGQNSFAATGAGDIAQANNSLQLTWDDATKQLTAWGIPEAEILNLRAAYEADGNQIAERTQGWLASFKEKVEQHALELAAGGTIAGVVDLLQQLPI